MLNLSLIYPEIALGAMALGLLLADLFIAPKHGKMLYHLAWLVSIVTLCLVGWTISSGGAAQGVGTLWSVDPLSQFFKMLVLLTTVLCLLLGLEYKLLPPGNAGTFVALLLFSACGMMFLVSSIDLLLIFVSLELISLASFILAGFERGNPKSNEGAMKYFLFGAFSSAIMAYGISLFYGATLTTKLVGLQQLFTGAAGGGQPMLILGILFILVGFGFKASLAPMHFWVPDAYEGAPTPVTTFLSLAPKIAMMGTLLRVFTVLLPASVLGLTTLFAVLAGLTMTVGNLTAMFQTNVKRLLAYSSIAQAGYMLIGIVSGNTLGLEGVLLYSFVYVAMNVGAFAIAQALGGSYELREFDGLARRNFGLALCMTFFMLSLAGIPPLAGFIGKFYIFSSAMQSEHYWLAAVAVVNSLISVYYYMKIVYHMFFRPAADGQSPAVGPYVYGGLALAVAGVLVFGLYPEPLIASVQASAAFLP